MFVALLFSCITYGQSDLAAYWGPYLFKKGDQKVVFSDTAFVRSAASVSAAITDTLFLFDVINIADTPRSMLLVGRKEAPWYKIRYNRNGKEKEGMLWGGAMAIQSMKLKGIRFACGVLSYPIPGVNIKDEGGEDLTVVNTFSIKSKSNGFVQECRYNISRESQYFSEEMDTTGHITDSHLLPSKGLPEGTLYYIRYNMSGEACGIPAYSIQAAWDGEQLIRMPLLQSSADGGEWYYDQAFIFPGQKGGKTGQLRIKTTEGTAIDGTDKMKETVTWRAYAWDKEKRLFK